MLPALLAARVSWVGILFILGGLCIAWIVIRAFVDFVEWFKEEIIEDFRDQRKRKSTQLTGVRKGENGTGEGNQAETAREEKGK